MVVYIRFDPRDSADMNNLTVGIGLALFVAELAGMLTLQAEYSLRSLIDENDRRIFHWRFSEPYPVIWSVCCHCGLPRLPLDILDWATPWCPHLRRILQIRQVQ